VKARDPEVSKGGSRRARKQVVLASRRIRYGWISFSLSLALVVAGLAMLFVSSPAGEPSDETAMDAARSDLAEAPSEEPPEEMLEESPASGEEADEAPGFDAEALEEDLEEIVGEHEGTYGISLLEPDSGTRVSLRGDEEFVAASIGKLPPFAVLYAAAARGEIDLEEEISIRSGDVQSYGSGKLHSFPVGHSLSLRDCAYYLVNDSDNTAWEMLDRRLGREEIGYELESMGVEDSSYYGHNSGYYTTPDDVVLLLEKISDPRFTDEELSVEMLDAMTETSVEDRIPGKLPEDVRIAHKTGSYDGNFGDAGVVFYRDSQGEAKRYYLSVLSEGTGEYEARDVIQDVSLAVYEAVTGDDVDPDWSRGSVRGEDIPAPPPAPQPAPAQNAGKAPGAVQPVKPPPVEKTPQRPPQNPYNAVPAPRPAPTPPPYPAVREPAYPRSSASAYYREEPGYWEDAYYWEGW
jgi:beta-lactamase class A